MLDIKLIREDVESFKERIKNRGGDAYTLFDELLTYDEVRRRCETEKQQLQGERNTKSKAIGAGKQKGEDTTEIETEFTYVQGAGYVFKFTGDDDVWVFIDGKLVIDLGSLHPVREQFIALDRLDWLEDGETYRLKIFHAERRTSASNFRMETTLPLRPVTIPSITAAFD